MENTVEQEVSLVNLFWKLMFGWKRILVLGIVFAVLLSGLKYARSISAYQAALDLLGSASEDVEFNLTQDEQSEVEDVLVLQKRINAARSYLQNSIWMNLDAFNENVLVLEYYVNSDYRFNYTQENSIDYTQDIMAAYCVYATAGGLVDVVADELGMDRNKSYIAELISTASGNEIGDGQNLFTILIAYTDVESLEQLKPVVEDAIKAQTKCISEEIGSHTLKMVADNITERVDRDLLIAQKDRNDALNIYRTNLTTLKDALSTDQLAALDQQMRGNDEEGYVETNEIGKPSYSVKYAILGFIVGAFLACIWLLLEALFALRIQGSEEISTLYGVRILGELNGVESKKKLFGMVDSLLIKWRDHNKKQMSKEQRIRIASSNLEIACKKAGVNQIYVTGSEIENQKSDITAEIWQSLSKSGIQVRKGENVVYDAKSLKEMAEIGNVVFVEQVGVSLYTEIEKEIKAAKDNGIEIIGSVVISNAEQFL